MTEENPHCVAALEPVRPGAKRSKVTSFSCYPTLSDAVLAATNGAVWLPPDEDLRTQLDRINEQQLKKARKPLSTKDTYVIAIDYWDANYQGATLTWTAPAPCDSVTSYQATGMGPGWNDVVSSTRGFANCNTNVLYENVYFGGALQICSPDCAGLGAMNDKTSSRSWSF
ncbi:MAG TPA: hypothetical protein VGP73_24620 [Thermoanaerobaculia bacterium]